MERGFRVFCIAAFAVAGIVQGAHAAATLTITDGIHPAISITDNGAGDSDPAVGELILSTNVGVWTLSVSSGATKPALGSASSPVMDLVVQATSTNSGSLTYTFSDNNFGPTVGNNLNTTISGQVIVGASASADYSVFGNSANVLGAQTTLLATTGTNTLPFVISNSQTESLSSPFSLTQVVQLTASGATSVSLDASLNIVPEPGTVALTVVGLAFVGGGMIRRRRS